MSIISRRNFFQARLNTSKVIRPPWAIAEEQFIELCSRCDKCISICPEKIIFRGDGGFPEVKFVDSGCELCEDCLDVCEPKVLKKTSKDSLPWLHKVEVITKCLPMQGVICRTCSEACNEDVISFILEAGKVAVPKLNLENCNGCGFCIAMCPVDAIVLCEGNIVDTN